MGSEVPCFCDWVELCGLQGFLSPHWPENTFCPEASAQASSHFPSE